MNEIHQLHHNETRTLLPGCEPRQKPWLLVGLTLCLGCVWSASGWAQESAPPIPVPPAELPPAEPTRESPAKPAAEAPPLDELLRDLSKAGDQAKPAANASPNTVTPPVTKPNEVPLVNDPLAPPATSRSNRSAQTGPSSTPDPISADQVINGLVLDSEQQELANRRDAALFFQQAKATLSAGNPVEALRLAQRARMLDKDNADLKTFAEQLGQQVRRDRMTTPSYTRAKAHLAAALIQSQDWLNRGQFLKAQDLLTGIVKATPLFPADAGVEIYRMQAEELLQRLNHASATGVLDLPSAPDQPVPAPAVLSDPGVQTPKNLRRVLRGSEVGTPRWYSLQKQALALEISVNYQTTPVLIVLEDVMKTTGLTMVVDESVRRSQSLLNGALTLKAVNLQAETILDIACQKAGVEYLLMERGIVITSASKAVQYLQDLPRAVRQNWAMARLLFPEMNPELFASRPSELIQEATATPYVTTPLQSGEQLLQQIQAELQ